MGVATLPWQWMHRVRVICRQRFEWQAVSRRICVDANARHSGDATVFRVHGRAPTGQRNLGDIATL